MTDIAEIIKRARDLLPRTADSPWLAGDEGVHTPKEYIDCFSTSGHTTPNAEFIAFARNNLLTLCDEVENLTKERDALHAEHCADLDRMMALATKNETLREENALLRYKIITVYDAIVHGDAEHMRWLAEKLGAHFAMPRMEP